MIERLENMIINRTCLMEEHIKDYIERDIIWIELPLSITGSVK